MLMMWIFSTSFISHTHLCLDGLEPPVSIQFGLVDAHPSQTDQNHFADVDIDQSKTLATKIFGVDLTALPLIIWLLIACANQTSRLYFSQQTPSLNQLFLFQPPLRAPPV